MKTRAIAIALTLVFVYGAVSSGEALMAVSFFGWHIPADIPGILAVVGIFFWVCTFAGLWGDANPRNDLGEMKSVAALAFAVMVVINASIGARVRPVEHFGLEPWHWPVLAIVGMVIAALPMLAIVAGVGGFRQLLEPKPKMIS